MKCPNCGVEIDVGMKFCKECGTPQSRECPQCHEVATFAEKYCKKCGCPLAMEYRIAHWAAFPEGDLAEIDEGQLNELKTLAAAVDPNPEILYKLAVCYHHGHGCERNEGLALANYFRAASLGHEYAHHVLMTDGHNNGDLFLRVVYAMFLKRSNQTTKHMCDDVESFIVRTWKEYGYDQGGLPRRVIAYSGDYRGRFGLMLTSEGLYLNGSIDDNAWEGFISWYEFAKRPELRASCHFNEDREFFDDLHAFASDLLQGRDSPVQYSYLKEYQELIECWHGGLDMMKRRIDFSADPDTEDVTATVEERMKAVLERERAVQSENFQFGCIVVVILSAIVGVIMLVVWVASC